MLLGAGGDAPLPSAVTSFAATRLSQVSPYLRTSQPTPPPRVRPAMPVARDDAGRAPPARAVGLAVEVAERRAALDPHGPRRGIDDDRAHLREVDHQAVVAERAAGDVVAAAAYRDEDVVARGRS